MHKQLLQFQKVPLEKPPHLLQGYRGSCLRNPTGVYSHLRGMQNTSAVRHHHTLALRWGSQALHCSQGHLSLSGRLHPRQSTFSLTKPALVLCLLRHLFLINSVYFSKRGQGGTCSGMQSDCVPYADTNHVFLHTSIHVFIYKPELYICKRWCVYIHISHIYLTLTLCTPKQAVCVHTNMLWIICCQLPEQSIHVFSQRGENITDGSGHNMFLLYSSCHWTKDSVTTLSIYCTKKQWACNKKNGWTTTADDWWVCRVCE